MYVLNQYDRMKSGVVLGFVPRLPLLLLIYGCLLLCFFSPVAALAEDKAKPALKTLSIVYLSRDYEEPLPLSLVDKIYTDKGLMGAKLSNRDNNKAAKFVGINFKLVTFIVPLKDDFSTKAKEILAEGHRLVVADLKEDDLLVLSKLPEAQDALIFNTRSASDRLRGKSCQGNLYHILPSWNMRADALAQYLLWKKWKRWFLVSGKSPIDKDFADAIKLAAKKYRAKIVEERNYKFEAGYRRLDSGHQQIQTQMPRLTQGAPDYDVLFVADAAEAFGEFLSYRSEKPRPVIGSHGLIATTWHRSYEQYAGTQMQNRFTKFSKRLMTARDYDNWLAIKIFGKVMIRIKTDDPKEIRKYILSDKFNVAAFKGRGLTFRKWNRQLRQPILLTGPKALVSMSPQDSILHPRFHTDTLGIDKKDSQCPFPVSAIHQ